MKLSRINKDNFELLKFPKESSFTYEIDNYKVEFTDPEEIRMSVYIRSVKVFKNNKLIKSFDTCDPSYFELTTIDKKFLALPTKDGIELTNLESGETAEFYSFFMIGNQFDVNSKYCLINGQNDSFLIDLTTLKIKFKYKSKDNYISQARFGFDNKLWTIEDWGQKFRIEKLDVDTLTSLYSIIEKPFEFFKIPIENYTKLMNSNTHCIWLMTGGGMRFSAFLNKWEHVPSKNKIIFKTLIPQSEVTYSKNYKVDSCDGEFEYVELQQDEKSPSTKKDSNDSTMWTKMKNVFK